MSPIATHDLSHPSLDTIAALKARVAESHAAVNERKPVEDDYMYDFKYNAPLPLLGETAIQMDDDSIGFESEALVTELTDALKNKDAEAYSRLFLPDGMYLPRLSCGVSSAYR